MTGHTADSCDTAPRDAFTIRSAAFRATPARSVFVAILETLLDWQERARSRVLLSRLDDRMLRDLGITRVDAARETDKPFWRA
jgi:uncharacterized protein YjiS (DUF1127 family)